MKVLISTTFNAPSKKVWQLLKQRSTLQYVSKGFISFQEVDSELPIEWQQATTVQYKMLQFGVIPIGIQTVYFKTICHDTMNIITNEQGGMVKIWNHCMSVKSIDDEQCIYTDEVDIDAGILTIVMWLYAYAFYQYRHYRWQTLVAQ